MGLVGSWIILLAGKIVKILVINPNHKKGENHETIHVHFDAAGNHIFLHRGASPGVKGDTNKRKEGNDGDDERFIHDEHDDGFVSPPTNIRA